MAGRLERHPLSAIWGDMPEGEYAELVESVRQEGILDYVIKTLDDQILDGWHRYRAAHDAGVPRQLLIAEYTGNDPAGFVIRKNAHRRHLTAGQRAICVAKSYEWAGTGSNQHVHKEGVTTRYTLEGQEGADESSADDRPDEVLGKEGVGEVGAERSTEGAVRPDDGRPSSAAIREVVGKREEESSATEGLATGSEESVTARLIAEKAQTTRKTAEEAKAIIRGGLAEAVLGGEMSFDAALRQARGPSSKPKEPTRTERLEAERDAARMDVQEKAEENERLERALREARAQMSEYPHEREKVATEREAIISTLRSQLNEYMVRANEDSQSLRYWKREAKQPCRNCGTEWEFTDD